MPYYCTVPHCQSMAGKNKNVSFHQFPKNKTLADKWNKILKRGKPYTKYSKVCSLHFDPHDYVVSNNAGKNRGQWRTLRKDAVPTRNLPPGGPPSPEPTSRSTNNSPGLPPIFQNPNWPGMPSDIKEQQRTDLESSLYRTSAALNMIKMIYVMGGIPNYLPQVLQSESASNSPDRENDETVGDKSIHMSALDRVLLNNTLSNENTNVAQKPNDEARRLNEGASNIFRCDECSRCFKDRDVHTLHKRSHKKQSEVNKNDNLNDINEKENLNNHNANLQEEANTDMSQANPMLAQLLNSLPRAPDLIKLEDLPNTNSVNNNLIHNSVMNVFEAEMKRYDEEHKKLDEEEKRTVDRRDSNIDSNSDIVDNVEQLDDESEEKKTR